MIDRRAIRDAVIAALSAAPVFADYWVDKFSDDPAEWQEKHLQASGGSMIVSYAGTRRQEGDENDPGRIGAVHVILFERSEDEGLDAIDEVEDLLHGTRLAIDGHPIRLMYEGDNFIEEVNRYYQYEIQLRWELL